MEINRCSSTSFNGAIKVNQSVAVGRVIEQFKPNRIADEVRIYPSKNLFNINCLNLNTEKALTQALDDAGVDRYMHLKSAKPLTDAEFNDFKALNLPTN